MMRAFSFFGPTLTQPHTTFSSGCGARGGNFGNLDAVKTGGHDFFASFDKTGFSGHGTHGAEKLGWAGKSCGSRFDREETDDERHDFFGKGEDGCHDRPGDTTDGCGCGARDDVPEADNCEKDTADETRTEDQPADDTPPCDPPEEDPSAASKDDICEEDNTPSGDLPVCALPGDAPSEDPHPNGIIDETPDLDDDAEQDGQDSIAGLPLIDLPEETADEAEDTLDWADMADALI